MWGRGGRARAALVVVSVLGIVVSGCALTSYTVREASFSPSDRPWWCTATAFEAPDPGGPYAGQVKGDLSQAHCNSLSVSLDLARFVAQTKPTQGDAAAAGLVAVGGYVAGVGTTYADPARPIDAMFTGTSPELVTYDGSGSTGQIAGLGWLVRTDSGLPPEGFAGANDWWSEADSVCLGGADQLLALGGTAPDCATAGGTYHVSDYWILHAWIIRPFEHHPDVFNPTHACLGISGPVYDTADSCFTDSHTDPLDILVTNDDGYAAPGIDALVEGLITVPGVNVEVVAPLVNKSGSGGKTTPTPPPLAYSAQTTLSGYPATAVDGFPADAVLVALDVLGVNPDLVISGLNNGANIGTLRDVSGTVGAARAGARKAIPVLAASQGSGTPDWPSGVDAVLAWLDDFQLGRAGPPFQVVPNMNVPSCTSGAIRGTLEVPSAQTFSLSPADCTSVVPAGSIDDDVEGFLNGFITIAEVGTGS